MVRSRLREGPVEETTPVRKGSKESARGKKRRPVVGGSPLGSDDEEDAFGACEEDEEGLEGLGVPLDSVVKVSRLKRPVESLGFLWKLLKCNVEVLHGHREAPQGFRVFLSFYFLSAYFS